jgi:methionyl-tRNA formyltransferase
MTNKPSIVFFGTDYVSICILEELKKNSFLPDLIVTQPDKPQGRKMIVTPPDVKVWADENNIQTLQPEVFDEDFINEITKQDWDLFIVASYGKIIPNKVLEIPKYKTLNIHPSLLPKYRGPTPAEQAILDDSKETGVTVMRMDEKMDHGPIVKQEKVFFETWPDKQDMLKQLATLGGATLCQIIPEWIDGKIEEVEQDHTQATFTKMISKEDGLINLEEDDYKNFLKYKAYKPWPGVFFFENGKRIKITDADFINNKFIIKKIIPEGKKETTYENLG